MTTLALGQVVDLDCLASLAPLSFDLPSPTRYARGPQAIARRVLYYWGDASKMAVSLFDLKGVRVDGAFLLRFRTDLERAQNLDYVRGLSCPLSWDGTRLSILGRLQLVDGLSYPLEVATVDAPAALLAATAALLGGSS